MANIQLAEGYVSVTEAAKRAGVSRSALYQAIREGRLPHTKISGVITILSVDDVDAFKSRAQSKPETKQNSSHKYTLEELVAGITDENRHDLIDWGPPRGNEAW